MQRVADKIQIELLEQINDFDLGSLCEAAEYTMIDTYGFTIGSREWSPPMQHELAEYFKAVKLIQERKLIVGRIERDIVGSLQLLLPHRLNKVSSFAVSIHDLFVINAARQSGIAEAMIRFAESYSKAAGYEIIKLSVRSDMVAAISLVEKLGYKKWGILDKYESVGKDILSGYFYCKEI